MGPRGLGKVGATPHAHDPTVGDDDAEYHNLAGAWLPDADAAAPLQAHEDVDSLEDLNVGVPSMLLARMTTKRTVHRGVEGSPRFLRVRNRIVACIRDAAYLLM
jgi:hypothetical protein